MAAELFCSENPDSPSCTSLSIIEKETEWAYQLLLYSYQTLIKMSDSDVKSSIFPTFYTISEVYTELRSSFSSPSQYRRGISILNMEIIQTTNRLKESMSFTPQEIEKLDLFLNDFTLFGTEIASLPSLRPETSPSLEEIIKDLRRVPPPVYKVNLPDQTIPSQKFNSNPDSDAEFYDDSNRTEETPPSRFALLVDIEILKEYQLYRTFRKLKPDFLEKLLDNYNDQIENFDIDLLLKIKTTLEKSIASYGPNPIPRYPDRDLPGSDLSKDQIIEKAWTIASTRLTTIGQLNQLQKNLVPEAAEKLKNRIKANWIVTMKRLSFGDLQLYLQDLLDKGFSF